MNVVRKSLAGQRWEAVEVLDYKPSGNHFRHISRQVLFDRPGDIDAQLRYFAIEADGHSTLERHGHTHAVVVLSGRGRVLIGERIHSIAPFDLVTVPSGAWHQFRADQGMALGFLCLVAADRDRPQRPGEEELSRLREIKEVADFIVV